jgi:hypothetical protein
MERISDDSDEEIISNMIIFLKSTGSREKALMKLAEKMNITVEDVQNKLNDIYDRMN